MQTYTFGPWSYGIDTAVGIPSKPEESSFLELSNLYMDTDGFPTVRPCLKNVSYASGVDGVVDHPTKGICFFTAGSETANRLHFDTPDHCGDTTLDGNVFSSYGFTVIASGVVNGSVWAYIKHAHQSTEVPFIFKMHMFDGRSPTYSRDSFVPNTIRFEHTPASIVNIPPFDTSYRQYVYKATTPVVEQISADIFVGNGNIVSKSAIAAPYIFDYRSVVDIEQDGIFRHFLFPTINPLTTNSPIYLDGESGQYVTFTTDISWDDISSGVDVTSKYIYVGEIYGPSHSPDPFEQWKKIDPSLISFVENSGNLSIKLATYLRTGWIIDPTDFIITADVVAYPGAGYSYEPLGGTLSVDDILQMVGSTSTGPKWKVTNVVPLTIVLDSAGDGYVTVGPVEGSAENYWRMKSTEGYELQFYRIPLSIYQAVYNDSLSIGSATPYFSDEDVIRFRFLLKPEIQKVSGFTLYPGNITIDTDGNSASYPLTITLAEASSYKVKVNNTVLTSDYYALTESNSIARIQFVNKIASSRSGYRVLPPTINAGGSNYNDGDIVELVLPIFDLAQPKFRVVTNKSVTTCTVYSPLAIGQTVTINGMTLTCVSNDVEYGLGQPTESSNLTTPDVFATTKLSETGTAFIGTTFPFNYSIVYADTNEVGNLEIVESGYGTTTYAIAETFTKNVSVKDSTASGLEITIVQAPANEIYIGIKQAVWSDSAFNKIVLFDGVVTASAGNWTVVYHDGLLYLDIIAATKPYEVVAYVTPTAANDIVLDASAQIVSGGVVRYEDKTYTSVNSLAVVSSDKSYICVRVNLDEGSYIGGKFRGSVKDVSLVALSKSEIQHSSYTTMVLATVVNGVAMPYRYSYELNDTWYAAKHLTNLENFDRSTEAGFFEPDNRLGVVTGILAVKDKLLITSASKSALYSYNSNVSQIAKLDEYQFGSVDPIVPVGSTVILNSQHGFKSVSLGGLNFDGISSSDIGNKFRGMPINLTAAVYWPALNCYLGYGTFSKNVEYAKKARLPESMIRDNSTGFVCYTASSTISSWSTWYISQAEINEVTGDPRVYTFQKMFVGSDPNKLYIYLKSTDEYPVSRVVYFDNTEVVPSYSIPSMFTISWSNLGNSYGSNRLHSLDTDLNGEHCKVSIGQNSYEESDFLDEILVQGSSYDLPRISIAGDARLISIHGKLDSETWALRESDTPKFVLKSLQLAYTSQRA